MGRLDINHSLDLLRRANAQVERFLQRFSAVPVMGSEEEVDALLLVERALSSVAGLLDGQLQKSEDRQLRQELLRYRWNLVHLRDELGRMQDSAMGCRERLQSRQKHLHAAQAWCAASRATSD
jgi:hypothetical protein